VSLTAAGVPAYVDTVVVGAGIHGLSTAWHLAALRGARGRQPDVLVLDKSGPGAGASGIACGVVRNNYFQPAMRRLMAHSVDIWERHAERLAYHPVGYLQISPEVMHADVAAIHEEQRSIGYPSTFVEGEAETAAYLRAVFPDWRAAGSTSVLHEHRGGYAHNQASVRGLVRLAEAAGARIAPRVTVTGFEGSADGVSAVVTDRGTVRCHRVVVGAGPWVRDLWRMLDLPDRIQVRAPDGTATTRPMWAYLALQEGTLEVDPGFLTDASGRMPPVVHLDSDVPLQDSRGAVVTDSMWGVYFKPDTHFGGVQGGAAPVPVDQPAERVAVDPYGPASPDFTVGAYFARMWTAALRHCLGRFEGHEHLFSDEPSGGIGCFTPDSFPVFDTVRGNVLVLADSNHGYKMVGVGALAAAELEGQPQPLLEPFRLDRFAAGRCHPVSRSPFPWS
jgi:glycine/D-amino acid oxidase-like deaminating enzyme